MTTQRRERMCTKCKEVKSHLDFSVYPDTCSTCVAKEVKALAQQREMHVVNQVARKASTAENLMVVLEDRTVDVLEDLVEELANLVHMTDANRSTPTDKGRRGHGNHLPSFDPAAAHRQLEDANRRLRVEYEKLAGAVRQPGNQVEPQCEECGRRVRVVDVYCGPCGAGILRQYRRTVNGG